MKEFHVSCSFAPGFDGFDMKSPIDIPTIDSLETLWEWMKYWKSDTPFLLVCHFYKLPDSDNYKYAMYQFISTSYVGYRGIGPVRSSSTVRNLLVINEAIRKYKSDNNITQNPIIIPGSNVLPNLSYIEPTKIIDIPFHEIEQEIANAIC